MAINLSTERRQGERRAEPRTTKGRRAIERMAATPAEIDRFAREAAIKRLGIEEYYDENFREWEET